mmetsp:Transcript_8942/g.17820  ORF Transcript_8942/g.17820 Transcript_8942/m.17820 type:complete len:1086 (+) Transcript_8942:50-3307(+)
MRAANTSTTRARRRRDSDEQRQALMVRPSRRRRGEQMNIITRSALFLPLLLLFGGSVNAKNNLLHSENVFGWQKPSSSRQLQQHQISRSRRQSLQSSPGPTTITTSPLRRSENVFGWNKQDSSPQRSNGNRRSIINVSNNNNNDGGGNPNNYIDDKDGKKKQQQQNLVSPPNIKIIQPRKKELWLPWPLGSLRNDFYKFASEQRDRQSLQQQQQFQQQQKRLRNYYSDEGYQEPNVFFQGREWMTRMLQRGESMLKGTIGGNVDEQEVESQQQQQSGYWIKDTTTPMATASATMSKKDSKNKNSRRSGKVLPNKDNDDNIPSKADSSSDRDVLFQYLKLQASIRLRQLGYVGSDFSVHLPPASPALVLLYMLPRKQDPLRRLVKFTMTTAAVSWMHSEATKYRRLAPLPVMKGCNVREPNLPPFLPEERVEDEKKLMSEVVAIRKEKEESTSGGGKSKSKAGKEEEKGSKVDKSSNDDSDDSSSTHHGWDLKSFGTISSAYRTWLEAYQSRNEQSYHQRRKVTQETLLALRTSSNSTKSSSDAATGYALVTGASRGIGRAIAVELARYNIPLILVARDVEKLSVVAKDIETHYGIPCRILQADLTSPDCASRIHAATTKAGLDVDILINNAGVCTHGDLIDGDVDEALRMIQLNVGSVVELSRLYGKNMKDRRRGRILFVSSMTGAMPGCPRVAVYAATKSFEKSLASSLGRELERYGVGVTCLLPGAVEDTSFASTSGVEDAACFHFPGYAKTPEMVAGEGIKGLMLGYPEVYPGWENRLFVKIGLPVLPSRVANMIGEWAWNPWQWGDATMPQRHGGTIVADKIQTEEDTTSSASSSQHASSLTWKFRRSSSNQMQLPDVPKETKKNASETNSKLPAPQFFDATAANLVPNNENPSSESEESQTEPPPQEGIEKDATEPTKSKTSVAQSTTDGAKNDDKAASLLLKDKPTPPTKGKEDIPENKVNPQKEDAFFIESTSDVSPQPMSSVLPLPPAAPTDKSTTSSSTPLLGFFDKDKDSESNSPQDKSLENDSKDKSEKKTSSSPEKDATVEILIPSMIDNQEYDFRDRRLDYTKMSVGKGERS